ncbi:MAG: tetratricopeptide repeat protein [Algicola sp.]|nr:tetratricopeptide repeat protein [Algicola sp.]
MPLQFKTCDRIVHVHQQYIVFNDETIKIRPKTFSLLLMFLQNPYQVLSKSALLAAVWDDVEVNEQVLFQTIRELRQHFGDEDVIKTHPRKGYAWVQPVEEMAAGELAVEKAAVDEIAEQQKVTTPQTPKSGETSWPRGVSLFVLCLSVIACLVGYFKYTDNHQDSAKLQGSLVILPVINNIQDTDHQWVYLGAMDQLISVLQSSEKLAVMDTVYVLEIMKDADITQAPNPQDIRRIFEVSGASLVVQSQLLGATQDYQLKYTLNFKNDIKRGVIFENDINEALAQLAVKIAVYTGQSPTITHHQVASEFGSELLVRALELQEKREHPGAVKLFNSLLQVEPDNIVAHRLLAKSYVGVSQFSQAKTQLLAAIELIKNSESDNRAELPRIHHGLAFVEYIQKNYAAAAERLLVADAFALNNNDWLYRAYIAQLQGMINLATKQFEEAYTAYNNALTYHGVIQCPIGISVTLLALSELAHTQGNNEQEAQYIRRAATIIDNRKLTLLNPILAHHRKRTQQKPVINQ